MRRGPKVSLPPLNSRLAQKSENKQPAFFILPQGQHTQAHTGMGISVFAWQKLGLTLQKKKTRWMGLESAHRARGLPEFDPQHHRPPLTISNTSRHSPDSPKYLLTWFPTKVYRLAFNVNKN